MNPTTDSGRSLSGEEFTEDEARKLLSATIAIAEGLVSDVIEAFRSPWSKNPSTAVRIVLGYWVVKSFRHLRAIIALAAQHDLVKVADVHHRQMLELFLQARAIISASDISRERLAQKVSAWGCVDYLDKTDRFKDTEFGRRGHQEITEQLSRYDPDLVAEIRSERSKGNMHWFGRSFTKLGTSVSKGSEDLGHVYRIASGESHGSWDIALDVASPSPGHLDFRGYPNEAQLLVWAADLVDQAMLLYLKHWNEVAEDVGAPQVQLRGRPEPSPFTPPV